MSLADKQLVLKLYFQQCTENMQLAVQCLNSARTNGMSELSAYRNFLVMTNHASVDSKIELFTAQIIAHTPCHKCAQKESIIKQLHADIETSDAAHSAVVLRFQSALDSKETSATHALHKSVDGSDKVARGLRAAFSMVSL